MKPSKKLFNVDFVVSFRQSHFWLILSILELIPSESLHDCIVVRQTVRKMQTPLPKKQFNSTMHMTNDREAIKLKNKRAKTKIQNVVNVKI